MSVPFMQEDIEIWIRRWRDTYAGSDAEWFALNDLLEDYLAHADASARLSVDIGLLPGWIIVS
jgi:hypothetical protein